MGAAALRSMIMCFFSFAHYKYHISSADIPNAQLLHGKEFKFFDIVDL
jgi:hypothetical protein